MSFLPRKTARQMFDETLGTYRLSPRRTSLKIQPNWLASSTRAFSTFTLWGGFLSSSDFWILKQKSRCKAEPRNGSFERPRESKAIRATPFCERQLRSQSCSYILPTKSLQHCRRTQSFPSAIRVDS